MSTKRSLPRLPRIQGIAVKEKSGWTWELVVTPQSRADLQPVVMGPKDEVIFTDQTAAFNHLCEHANGVMQLFSTSLRVPKPAMWMHPASGRVESMRGTH